MGGDKNTQEVKTLYVSDLDGTLLNAESRISGESLRMLNCAIERGALFTIATARTPATVATIIEGLDLQLDTIVMTGAARWNAHTGIYSHVKYFPRHLAESLISLLRREHYPAFIYTLQDNLIRIYRVGPMTAHEREFIRQREHTPFKRIMFDTTESGDVWQQPMPDTGHVVLFYSLQRIEDLERFFPCIEAAVPQATALHYVDHDLNDNQLGTLEIFAPTASKAAAVRELAREVGAEHTVVFGDNVNDMTMMRIADEAIAPANAIEEVKQLAHSTIGANTEHSVAAYILEHTPGQTAAQS